MNARQVALAAALMLLPQAAAAKLPHPPHCVVPPMITVVGRDASGAADPIGEFVVTMRDLGNLPIPNAMASVRFDETPDVRICTDQAPGGEANCAMQWVSGFADMSGTARLRVVGHADHGVTPISGARAKVYGDGAWVADIRVATLDHDGGGMRASDLSLWLGDYFSAPDAGRSDYDGDGALGPADLSIWMTAFFAGGSSVGGAAPNCP